MTSGGPAPSLRPLVCHTSIVAVATAPGRVRAKEMHAKPGARRPPRPAADPTEVGRRCRRGPRRRVGRTETPGGSLVPASRKRESGRAPGSSDSAEPRRASEASARKKKKRKEKQIHSKNTAERGLRQERGAGSKMRSPLPRVSGSGPGSANRPWEAAEGAHALWASWSTRFLSQARDAVAAAWRPPQTVRARRARTGVLGSHRTPVLRA